MRPRQMWAGFVLLVLSVVSAFGQAVSGTMLGSVSDTSGAVVSGAKVTAQEISTGGLRSANTNEGGNFTFPDLPPGTYKVTVDWRDFSA